MEDDDVQEFMKKALDSCPALICETNSRGQTLLHLIAYYYPEFIDESVLRMVAHYFKRFEEGHGSQGLYLPPWRIKDEVGDTPFHTALKGGATFSCFRAFLEFDGDLAGYQNNKKQTPLHLLSHAKLSANSIKKVTDIMRTFVKAGGLCDEDGLTPLLKAAREADIMSFKVLHRLQRPYWLDERTKTPWFLTEVDSDGNTPLHIAIEKENFPLAKFIMQIVPNYRFDTVIYKRNKKESAPIDLIGSAENVPSEFENFIWSKPELMKVLLGARSLKGIPTRMSKEYTNTIGVIAALLATITFTAAFTVPGGLDTTNGTPILMRNAAFQVFMVSDIISMCLSMMVLFCLLWTMGNQKERVVILDLAIFLLEMSFYATLVAFMTGLYVTTIHIASWVAIFACALCSLLILLMHERVVTSAIRPIIKIALIYRGVASLFSDFLYLLLCCVPRKLKLELHQHELVKTWKDGGYFCDQCDKPGSNSSFCCEKCEFYLHPECALKNDTLWWVPKRAMICCSQQPDETNGSGRNITDHGDARTEQVALRQPNWRTDYNSEKMKLKLHDHELVMTWRSAYRCDGCKNPTGCNWSFYCKECDFDLHPECALNLKNDEKAEGEDTKVEATEEEGTSKAKDDESKAEAN